MKDIEPETKTKEQADQEAKEKAHKTLTAFNNLCDLYNEGGLDDRLSFSEPMLVVYHDIAKEALALFKKLLKIQPRDSVQNYMIFVAKIIIRISSLRHNHRRETDKERYEHIALIRKKYCLTI